MSDFKPLILNEDHSLVDHDLTNVYGHWLSDDSAVISQQEVKFKKKENIDSLKKSVLKHRIRILTGKDLSVIESEVKKTIDSDTDLKKLAKLLILEAAGKLPAAPVRAVVENSRKRTFEDVASEEVDEQPPIKRRPGRKSVAAFASPAVPTPKRPSRRSMMPQIPVEVQDPEEEMEEDEPVEENEEEELDLSDLGPNPTPQMIELKRKKLQAKKNGTPKKNGSPKKKLPQPSAQIKPSKILKKKEDPPKVEFSGENCNIYLVNAEEKCKFDCNGLEKITDGKFQGANLTFIHTPVSWTPSDVFATTMNIKFVNRKAGLDSYLVMVGCGIQNLHMIMEALKRHTKHVQMVVFERDDMNQESETNDFLLRETISIFLLAYFYPDCEKEGSLPPSRMVRANMTTCFRTKNIEDLENTIIHTFSEEGDWVLDVCCSRRELSLAAQKSGRNAIALESDLEKLKFLAGKATAIAQFHDPKFRQGVDGRIQNF